MPGDPAAHSRRLRGPVVPLATSWPYLASALGSSVGLSAFSTLGALYVTRAVGRPPIFYGVAVGGCWLVVVPMGVVLADLADRWDATLVVLGLGASGSLIVALFAARPDPFMLLISLGVLMVCALGARTALGALVRRTFGAGCVHLRALLLVCSTAGIGLGVALGALPIFAEYPAAYRLVSAGATVSLALGAFMPLAAVDEGAGAPPVRIRRVERPDLDDDVELMVWPDVAADTGNLMAAASVILLRLTTPLLEVVLPLWLVIVVGAPWWFLAVALVVNVVMVVALQYRLVRRIGDLGAVLRWMWAAGPLLGAGAVLYGLGTWHGTVRSDLGVLIAASAALTLGQMIVAACTDTIGRCCAPDGFIGDYYEWFLDLSSFVAQGVGPLLLLWLVIDARLDGWLIIGVIFLLAALGLRIGGRRAGRE